ncbi:MAG: DUF3048 domain-containing protein [Candidatus Kerfeldbacteria bacterium]|nr:DUF3048 domain-containing protein [Candidatus Kerfeldbacteria bacterium]
MPVPKSRANPWLFAVMIDGHANARPPAGLKKASVVYEALAEGGIPRFMAIFSSRDVGLIGPVRSARPYFVRWAAEYRAAFAHAGGSPDGLRLLNSLRMPNVEGIKGKTAKYFFRYGGNGVHNLFTNSPLLTQALRQARYDRYKPTYRPWKFSLDLPLAERRKGLHGAEVDLAAGRTYDVRYEYDRQRNIYRRFTGGRPHLDRPSGKQLYAKNVVLLLVPKERVLDRQGRLELKILGRGKAILLKDGRSVTVNWRKPTTYGRTIFTDSRGKEISFNRGPIWITAVSRGHRYTLF